MNQTKIGIDAGGTLIKVAYRENEVVNYQSFLSGDIDDVSSWLNNHFESPEICVTGGKSQVLAEKLNVSVKSVVEFDATTQGIKFLASQQYHSLGEVFLFVNVGTGTSIHYVSDREQRRVGGSGVGGGTFMGLSYLLTGIQHYEKMVQAAGGGNRENADLKVKDIFEGAIPPISGDLTASNFGKNEAMTEHNPSESDIIASVIGLIGEVIVTISTQMAQQYNVKSIVYIGSSFRSNPLLKNIIEEYTILTEKIPVFLEDGEYSGAVGSLLLLN